MSKKRRFLSLYLCVASLSACTTYSPSSLPAYQYSYEDTHFYPDKYQSGIYSSDQDQETKQVMVPESYHVGVNHSPTPHTDRDRTWMDSQSAQSYTIELAEGDNASRVASTLYKAPKNDRMAEIKYQKEGKTYYKGVYGSYPNLEAAQGALKALPQDMQQTATIKTWGSVQDSAKE